MPSVCITNECGKTVQQAKLDVERFPQGKNLSVKVDTNYAFTAWDKIILPLFEHGRGALFPGFLTWRASVDKFLIDLMCPQLDASFRPERFSDILPELHSKTCTKRCIKHKYQTAFVKILNANKDRKYSTFGDFRDKSRYRCLVPTGK